MNYNYLPLDNGTLTFQQVKNLLKHNQFLSITYAAHESIVRCREYLDSKINSSSDLFYGINTGFGFLQDVQIEKEQLNTLQSNLLLSHACGMGEEVPDEIVKLMMMIKIKSLSYGYSGIGIEVVKRLMEMYNHDLLPGGVYARLFGRFGRSGTACHFSLPLIGKGEIKLDGKKMKAEDALKKMEWAANSVQSKEGLALINGTQFMSAYGIYNLVKAEKLLNWANIIAAISFDAFNCNPDAFMKNFRRFARIRDRFQLPNDLENFKRKRNAIKEKSKFRILIPFDVSHKYTARRKTLLNLC